MLTAQKQGKLVAVRKVALEGAGRIATNLTSLCSFGSFLDPTITQTGSFCCSLEWD